MTFGVSCERIARAKVAVMKGRDRAMARGAKFGRKPKLTKHQREEALPDGKPVSH